jgi:hypothetical protein
MNSNKMEELPLHKRMFLLFNSQVSDQIGDPEMICEEYANADGMHITMLVC